MKSNKPGSPPGASGYRVGVDLDSKDFQRTEILRELSEQATKMPSKPEVEIAGKAAFVWSDEPYEACELIIDFREWAHLSMSITESPDPAIPLSIETEQEVMEEQAYVHNIESGSDVFDFIEYKNYWPIGDLLAENACKCLYEHGSYPFNYLVEDVQQKYENYSNDRFMITQTGVQGPDTLYVVKDFITRVEFYVTLRNLKNPKFNIVNAFMISAYNNLGVSPATYAVHLVDTRLGNALVIGTEKELNSSSDMLTIDGCAVPRYSV